jgi:hypothetical protein
VKNVRQFVQGLLDDALELAPSHTGHGVLSRV